MKSCPNSLVGPAPRSSVLLVGLLTLLPSALGQCQTLAFPSGSFCAPVLNGQNLHDQYTNASVINGMAGLAASIFTGTSGCTTNGCQASEVQGSATTGCLTAVQELFCLEYASPVASDVACTNATISAPSVDNCVDVFTACSATIDTSLAEREGETIYTAMELYCGKYACGSDADCSSLTCAPATSNSSWSTCDCGADKIGASCGYDKLECPSTTPDADCSAHGDCNEFTGACACTAPFSGANCASTTCPTGPNGVECSDNGLCWPTGVCQCDVGFLGSNCEIVVVEAGMTSGELAGVVIGSLIFVFVFCGLMGWATKRQFDAE